MGQTDESHREPRGPDKSTSDMTTAEMVVLLSRRVLTPRRIRELLSVVGQVDQLESHVRALLTERDQRAKRARPNSLSVDPAVEQG